jgi:hypothetical protein
MYSELEVQLRHYCCLLQKFILTLPAQTNKLTDSTWLYILPLGLIFYGWNKRWSIPLYKENGKIEQFLSIRLLEDRLLKASALHEQAHYLPLALSMDMLR